MPWLQAALAAAQLGGGLYGMWKGRGVDTSPERLRSLMGMYYDPERIEAGMVPFRAEAERAGERGEEAITEQAARMGIRGTIPLEQMGDLQGALAQALLTQRSRLELGERERAGQIGMGEYQRLLGERAGWGEVAQRGMMGGIQTAIGAFAPVDPIQQALSQYLLNLIPGYGGFGGGMEEGVPAEEMPIWG